MLNTLIIKNAKSTGKPYRIADEGGPCKGLGLCISAKGHKSYALHMRVNDVRKKWTIGATDDVSLSDARIIGSEWRKLAKKGIDPKAKPEKLATVQELCEGYIQSLKDNGKKRWDDAERTLEHDCKIPLYKKQANEVTSQEIADVIRGVVNRKALSQANRVRAYLHAAYAWGMSADLDTTLEKTDSRFKITTNPVSPIPKPQKGTVALDRWLSEEEIKQVWYVLPKYTGPLVVSALRLMLATGQRTEEVLSMKWTDIEDDIWHLPTTKNGKPHDVVLNETALSIIEEVRALTGKGEVLFLQKGASKTVMESNTLSHATRRLCKAEKLLRFTPRDLRRTFKSMALKHGLQKDILDRVQNHSQHDVSSRHYIRWGFIDEKRTAMLEWNKTLGGILK